MADEERQAEVVFDPNGGTEIKTFAEDDDGWILHITVRASDHAEAWARTVEALETLRDLGWKAHRGFGAPSIARVAAQGGGDSNGGGETVPMKCPDCGGKVYDNRKRNEERRRQGKKSMPEFRCANEDKCGWVKWPKRDDD